jgi:hypothetical protein
MSSSRSDRSPISSAILQGNLSMRSSRCALGSTTAEERMVGSIVLLLVLGLRIW